MGKSRGLISHCLFLFTNPQVIKSLQKDGVCFTKIAIRPAFFFSLYLVQPDSPVSFSSALKSSESDSFWFRKLLCNTECYGGRQIGVNVCRVKYQLRIMKSSVLLVIFVSTHIENDMRQVALILQNEIIIFINNYLSKKGHSQEFV